MWIILDYLVVNNHLGVPDVFDARPEELEFSYDISQGEQANVLGRLNIPINATHNTHGKVHICNFNLLSATFKAILALVGLSDPLPLQMSLASYKKQTS